MRGPKPNTELTTMQKDLLRLYAEHESTYRAPPTQRWLAERLGVYQSAVAYQLKRLTMLGWLKERPITAMRLELSSKARKGAA